MADTQSYLNRQFDCAVRIWILMQVCRNPSLGSVHILGLHLLLSEIKHSNAVGCWSGLAEDFRGKPR